MKLEKRHWLSWSEAAEILGFDDEGLRQEMMHRASLNPRELWLPAYVSSRHDLGFFSSFGFDGYDREVQQYAIPDLGDDLRLGPCVRASKSAASASNSFELPNIGGTETLNWSATHDHGTGWRNCYILRGMLILHPEAVAAACEMGGYFDGLRPAAAPLEWCDGGLFPREYFCLDFDAELLKRTFDEASGAELSVLSETGDSVRFRGVDVKRALASANNEVPLPAVLPSAAESRLRPQREQNLLRVIAGLWALSDLPKAHNVTADKLSALFDSWGWDGPGKSTIADTILKPAASLPKSES